MASIYLTLPPNKTISGKVYPRNGNSQTGTDIAGTAAVGRSIQYSFIMNPFADGDYEIDVYMAGKVDSIGNWKVRLSGSSSVVADSWFELDQFAATAEIQKIPRAAATVVAGAPVERHIVNGQVIVEVIDGAI